MSLLIKFIIAQIFTKKYEKKNNADMNFDLFSFTFIQVESSSTGEIGLLAFVRP